MVIIPQLLQYTFSWDFVEKCMCHGMRLGDLGKPGPCGIREETPEDLYVVDPLCSDALM